MLDFGTQQSSTTAARTRIAPSFEVSLSTESRPYRPGPYAAVSPFGAVGSNRRRSIVGALVGAGLLAGMILFQYVDGRFAVAPTVDTTQTEQRPLATPFQVAEDADG